MSHVTAIDLEIKDIQALKLACEELGLNFKENQKTYRWYGKWVNDYRSGDAAFNHGIKPEDYGKGEHAVEVPGSKYDIGVHRSGEGYKLAFDFWGTGKAIQEKVGKGGEKIKQLYAVHAATLAAKRKGWIVQRKTVGSKIELNITGM
jgi:hypothetical protein